MRKLFLTDFLKSRIIQLITLSGGVADLWFAQSLYHTLILFGLPYSISVLLNYLMDSGKPYQRARVSAQYRRPS